MQLSNKLKVNNQRQATARGAAQSNKRHIVQLYRESSLNKKINKYASTKEKTGVSDDAGWQDWEEEGEDWSMCWKGKVDMKKE